MGNIPFELLAQNPTGSRLGTSVLFVVTLVWRSVRPIRQRARVGQNRYRLRERLPIDI
jgi:hypothetical protein